MVGVSLRGLTCNFTIKIIFILPMLAAMVAVSGCQPKSTAKDEQPASSASVKEQKAS